MTNPAFRSAGTLDAAPLARFFAWETSLLWRGRGTWWKRSVYVVLSAAIVFLMAVVFSLTGSPREVGLHAFQSILGLNLYGAFVLTTAYFSKAVSGHREAGTLELLRISGLSPLALILGLGTSQFVRAALMLLTQLPLAFFCVTLGGITFSAVAGTYLLAIVVLFFLCHAGVFWSVVSKSSRHAASGVVITGIGLYILPSILVLLGHPRLLNLPAWVLAPAGWLERQNPQAAFATILTGGAWPITTAALHLGLGLLFLGMAAWRFEPNCEERENTPPLEARPGATQKRRKQAVPRVQSHPLTWKEFHFAAGGAWACQLRWTLSVAGAALVGWVTKELGESMLLVGVVGLMVELPRAALRIIGTEVRERTLGDLAILPIGPWHLVWEKARGHVPVLLPGLCLLVAGAVLERVPSNFAGAPGANWLIAAYVAWQFGVLFLLTIYLSLRQPEKAYFFSLFGLVLVHVLLSALKGIFGLPLSVLGALSIGLSGWLAVVLIRAFPTALYQTAAK